MRTAVLLAVAGAVLVAVGVGVVLWPAGVVVAGVELLVAGYGAAYVSVRKGRA